MNGGKISIFVVCKIYSANPVKFRFWMLEVSYELLLSNFSKQEVSCINTKPSGQVETTQPKKVFGTHYYPETLESVIAFPPNLEKLELDLRFAIFFLGAFSWPRPLLSPRGILYAPNPPSRFHL